MLSDGLPGHVNQSIGISMALDERFPHEPIIVPVILRHKLLRPLMRLLANSCPALISRFTLSIFYRLAPFPNIKPSLIISAGGNTLFANAAMARIYGISNIFSGTSKGYRHSLVRLIFTVSPLPNPLNNVVLDLPPANINTGKEDAKRKGPTGVYALLIGGNGAGYQYQESDWRLLAIALQDISRRDGIRWLLTTSRRTGEKDERLLNSILADECCEQAVWYASKPAKVVRQFLLECDAVFCTEDSLTMVSEAIYAQKPVVTLQPDVMHPEQNDVAALEKYAERAFIQRIKISELSQFVLSKQDFCENYPNIQAQIVQAVEEHCL